MWCTSLTNFRVIAMVHCCHQTESLKPLRTTAIFLSFIPNENYFKITCVFTDIWYSTSFQEPEITDGSAESVLKICAFSILSLLTEGNRSYAIWVSSNAKTFIPRFIQFDSPVQKLKWADFHRQVCSCVEEKQIKMGGNRNMD